MWVCDEIAPLVKLFNAYESERQFDVWKQLEERKLPLSSPSAFIVVIIIMEILTYFPYTRIPFGCK